MCGNDLNFKEFTEMVRAKGLEPSHLAVYAPQTLDGLKLKSVKSTN